MRKLKVSDNKRFLVHDDGKETPFFYLGDTAWELFHRCNREEADFYLADRAAKNFTVIQAVAFGELDGLITPNPYGHTPIKDNDPTQPDEDYFQHVDYIVNKANSLGLFIGLLPTWGDKYNRKWGIGPEVFTVENARVYGRWLGKRYRDKDVIWILGGDRPLESERHLLIVRAMAEGLKEGDGGTHLLAFHPPGGQSSSKFVHCESWLDFHMIQSGHVRDRANYEMIAHDYGMMPTRPCMDAEPGYEDHPNSFNPDKGWLDEHDVRKSLYWSTFAGGCGYTYGCHDIWQMWTPERKKISWARTPWKEAVSFPGSAQVQYGRKLLESRPYLTRFPDQSVIKSDNSNPAERIAATRCANGSCILVYLPASQRVTIDTSSIAGPTVNANWYNPRTGGSIPAGSFAKGEPKEFYTPYEPGGRDWVLVLDDAAANFPPPGTTRP